MMLEELEEALKQRVTRDYSTVIMERTAHVDPRAHLGDGTHVWNNANIGEIETGVNCVIGSNVYIGQGSRLGKNVHIQHGAFLPNNTRVGNDVFIGPNVTMTDDKYPQVNNPDYNAQPPTLADNCSIGAGSVLLPGVCIGKSALVGAGSVVTKDVKPYAIVKGNPARVIRSKPNGK
jgi:acetyltransferase-like isoleucine patch superfamily enzyme